MAKRGGVNLDSEDNKEPGIDLTSLVMEKPARASTLDEKVLKETAEDSGFVSREIKKTRRRGKRSPYKEQKNIKIRLGVSDLYIDVGEKLGVNDNELFDLALQALLEKKKLKDELSRLKEILKK